MRTCLSTPSAPPPQGYYPPQPPQGYPPPPPQGYYPPQPPTADGGGNRRRCSRSSRIAAGRHPCVEARAVLPGQL
ncbi:hypothetical protein FNJ62_22015 [Streptomyces benahoarensis]|uniref:Uncharacterized protein n=1 Tax=Streptomyces benahoarensis TaxID=2595054 RepID=A0A553Z875_9ACTN|nr:hypothetical protein FNJ62_22015 [Streptomyces benahoarensis]TSB37642.1 hypothetical protein FNZ23_18335 [Streptomyces benahoarensis]